MNLEYYLKSPGPIWGGYFWDRKLEKRLANDKYLDGYGYKVYSQNDEDGIIHEIFNRIGIKTKRFVEFGVDRGIESNTHALLLQGWSGLWIEGRKEAARQIERRFAPAIRIKQLKVINKFVTRDNIDDILVDYCGDIGIDLLSIDVDGNDWHIWNAISSVKARVVVIEYNGKFPPEIDWKMAYNEDHYWDRSDREGASLKALELLGNRKGYKLVGTNMCGVNAFFVDKDELGDLFPYSMTSEELFNPARYNIVPYISGHPARNYIASDVEGMEGVFEYYPDWNYIAIQGFYPVRMLGEMREYLMQERTGKIFLRNIPESAKIIRIYYSCPESLDEFSISGDTMRVTVDDTATQEYVLHNRKGHVDFQIKDMRLVNRIISVIIEVSRLYRSEVLYGGVGSNYCGLSITNIEYFGESH